MLKHLTQPKLQAAWFSYAVLVTMREISLKLRRTEVKLLPWPSLVFFGGLYGVWIVVAYVHCLGRYWSVLRTLLSKFAIVVYWDQYALELDYSYARYSQRRCFEYIVQCINQFTVINQAVSSAFKHIFCVIVRKTYVLSGLLSFDKTAYTLLNAGVFWRF